MKSFLTTTLVVANLAAYAEEIVDPLAIVEVTGDELAAIAEGVAAAKDLIEVSNPEDVTLVPTPIVKSNEIAKKPPGKWTDEQKLTLETFKEVVAADVENVWVVAYIDPRCRDCMILSVEWEKLTQIEEKTKRKIKLGYVDISVEENWKII